MYLKQLDIAGFRNLKTTSLSFEPGLNIFYGMNGSGKTSILEAIHVLGLGRSFRTTNLQQAIQFTRAKYIITGIIAENSDNNCSSLPSIRIGTEKAENFRPLFIKGGEQCAVSTVARLLPLQLINSSSIELLEGGPSWRRNFIDIGLFHVEQSFLGVYQQFKRCLLQRNAELKGFGASSQKKTKVSAWNETFISLGEAIDIKRRDFIKRFTEIFNSLVIGWPFCRKVVFQYRSGWNAGMSLKQALEDGFFIDLASGCSNLGPHRADLEIYVEEVLAKNLLSRGQQKAFSFALSLARALLLQQQEQINSVFLVDDLNSELDKHSYQLVLDKLMKVGGQIFLTEVEKGAASIFSTNGKGRMFHVEQGAIHCEQIVL